VKRLILAILTVALSVSSSFCGTDTDRLAKCIQALSRENTIKSATALFSLLTEVATKARQPILFIERRRYEMMINDLQDALGTFMAPEAQKVFSDNLARSGVEIQIALCLGLKLTPPHAEFDAAVLKLLSAPKAEPRLKVAAMELLAAHKHVAAVNTILPFLSAEEFQTVQIAACRALAVLPEKRSIPALIKYMESFKNRGTGRYMHEATAALSSLTKTDFVAQVPAWIKWWSENEKSFILNPDEELKPNFNYELQEASEYSYYDIPIVENRFVFVLDISGSMDFGGNPNRLTQAKADLKKIIGHLNEKQQFNIVVFSTGNDRWQRKVPLVPANEQMKKDATRYVDALKPHGGTQTTTVMEDVLREIASTYGCEAIYLVTDGSPNPWAPGITSAQQARHITWINMALKVRINTIGIYTTTPQDKLGRAHDEDLESMKEFLYTLATFNDGLYKEIGKDKDAKGGAK
jgi:hypothetical protein